MLTPEEIALSRYGFRPPPPGVAVEPGLPLSCDRWDALDDALARAIASGATADDIADLLIGIAQTLRG